MTKRGIEWESAVEGESNSVEQWEGVVKKWNPFNRQLAKILASMDSQNRADTAEGFSKIPGGDQEGYMQFATNLASLSDEAFQKISLALGHTE